MKNRWNARIAFALLLCTSLTACNSSNMQSDSQRTFESSSSSTFELTSESMTEEAEVSNSINLGDSELLKKTTNAYSTILVTNVDKEIKVETLEALKRSSEINSDSSGSDNTSRKTIYMCKNIVGDLILSNCIYGEVMGELKTLYNMNNEEQHSVLSAWGFVSLPNGKYAGLVPPIHLEGEFSKLDIEYYKEQVGIDYSILLSKPTTHPITEKSIILFDRDGSLSEVQLDMSNDRLRIEMDEIKDCLVELGIPYQEPIHEFDPVPYAQGVAYSLQNKQYYVPYAVNYPFSLKIAVFNQNGDLVDVFTFDEIQASSVRYSLVVYQSLRVDENTVFFDGSSYGVSSFLLDLSTETVVMYDPSSSNISQLIKAQGYYRSGIDYKKALIPPPFTIEASNSEDEMIIRLVDDSAVEVIVSSEYYLVDWEQTESGFQAILGYLPYMDREQFLANEMQYQPWDYRSNE